MDNTIDDQHISNPQSNLSKHKATLWIDMIIMTCEYLDKKENTLNS